MKIDNGKEFFYQWDLNRTLTSTELKLDDEVHFSNILQPKALPLKPYELDGKVVVDVPNILLQSSHPISVYHYVKQGEASFTVAEYQFIVKQKPKPDDYVYTETEILNYASLDHRITELEKSGGNSGEDGFSPIATVEQTTEGATITITDKNGTTVATVTNGKDGKDGLDGKNGVDGKDGYTPQKGVDYFDGVDGKDGVNGKDGEDGYSPVRGTDYWTPNDIAEIKLYVDEAILGGAW